MGITVSGCLAGWVITVSGRLAGRLLFQVAWLANFLQLTLLLRWFDTVA